MNIFNIKTSPIIIGIIGYLLYLYLLKNISLQKNITRLFSKSKSSFFWIQITRIIGFLTMSILPFIYINLFNIPFWQPSYFWTHKDFLYIIILSFILIPIGAFNARDKKHLLQYPQVRMKIWNPIEYILNILSWGIYLLGYEYLFRGILFLGLLPFFNIIQAIIINTLLYSVAHIYKGKKEILGSIPLGIILCVITMKSNTIWPAFTIHWIMSTNNFIWSEYFSRNLK